MQNENCKNCGHRISRNTDEQNRLIINAEMYHHKNGHGKKLDEHGFRIGVYCNCRIAESQLPEIPPQAKVSGFLSVNQ